MVYWISLWLRKYECCRRFWTSSGGRHTQKNWRNLRKGIDRLEIETVRDAETISIAQVSVVSTLKIDVHMRKLVPRWVPRLVTIEHKRNRVTTLKWCLVLFHFISDEVLRRFITADETWLQWVFPGESGPKKAKVGMSVNQVMATVARCTRYNERGIKFKSEYYAKLLAEKTTVFAKKIAFFHINSRKQSCVVALDWATNRSYIHHILLI